MSKFTKGFIAGVASSGVVIYVANKITAKEIDSSLTEEGKNTLKEVVDSASENVISGLKDMAAYPLDKIREFANNRDQGIKVEE